MITMKHFGRGAWRTKLSSLHVTGRRATLLVVPLLTLASLVVAAIPAPKVSAAVPTFKWIDSTTIQVSGGEVDGTFKITGTNSAKNGLAYSGSGDVKSTANCWVNLAIGVPAAENNGTTDYSKALLWTGGDTKDGHKSCAKPTDMNLGGISSGGKLYTITNVSARSKDGEEPTPEPVNDPEDKQIVNLKLETGWNSVYTTPNPSNPPKEGEMVPQEDLWVLCGNQADPDTSYEPYAQNAGQVPNYDQMYKDCLNRKSGWVIQSERGPINSSNKITYSGKFTGVAKGRYVACDFITNSCVAFQKEANKVKTLDNWPGTANPLAKVPGAETDADSAENEPEVACDVTFDLTTIFSLKWLVCPIVNTATFAVGKLEDVINSLLTVDVQDIFDDSDTSNSYHKAWNSFRVFALGLVVIAALVMVVSQAAGVEILDAYTVRKVLPRLLFAAIFIALSWDILEFLCQLSNDAGKGLRTLIYAPFIANNKAELGGGSSIVLTMLGTGAALGFGWVGLLSFALTGLLAAAVAFAVLVFRKMLILLLVMMAPFAIAAYILPNTQKLWEFWKGALASVLLVFPIISVFIAIGRVTAVTSFNAPGIQIVNQLIGFVAYFAPYFLIPLAFRMAGGFLATISGMANDRSRGAFDRLKNFRGNKMQENMQRMGTGTRFQNSNPFAKRFNDITGGVGTFAKSRSKWGMLTNGQVRRSAFAQQRALNQMAYAGSDRAKVAAENDPMLRAQTYINEAEARRRMGRDWGMSEGDVESAIAAAKANGGFGRDQQVNAARRLFSTGTGYDNLRQVHETVARVANGNEDMQADILGFGNAESGGKGRLDLKVGFGEHMRLQRELNDNGSLSDERIDQATMEAVRGNDVLSVLRGKPTAVRNVTGAMSRTLDRAQRQAVGGANDDEKEQGKNLAGELTGIIRQYEQNGAYASPGNVRHVDEAVGNGDQNIINIRQDVQMAASPIVMQRNRDGQLEPVRTQQRDQAGNVVTQLNPQTGRQEPVMVPVRQQPDQDYARTYNQQRPQSMYPDDPNNPRFQ